MDFDFIPFFKRYEAISTLAQNVFDRVCADHPSCVNCVKGCDDCCYALFDLTFIEALYINHKFNMMFQGDKREALIEKANRIDRQIYKIKKKAFRQEESILLDIAKIRMQCPLLDDHHFCEMYEYRPITCKLYGIPTAIKGVGYSCGKSNFFEGQKYPTVHLDAIQKQLFEISADLISTIKSKHVMIAEMLVPLSMALLTDYDHEYIGIDGYHEEHENTTE